MERVEQEPPGERRRAILRLLGLVVGLGLIYAAIPLDAERWWIGVLVGLVVVASIVPFTLRRAAAIETSRHPMLAAAEAVIIVVAMIVFAFSVAYLAINRNGEEFNGLDTKIDAMYFTVVTLSTVGFGDITATGQFARMAVTTQILVDISLLAMSVRAILTAVRGRTGFLDPQP